MQEMPRSHVDKMPGFAESVVFQTYSSQFMLGMDSLTEMGARFADVGPRTGAGGRIRHRLDSNPRCYIERVSGESHCGG
jgi:hypothetical protein